MNPVLRNNERTNDDQKACPTSQPVNGVRVCAARPSALLRIGGVTSDVWVSTKTLQRYYLRPAGRASEPRPVTPVGSHVYFPPVPILHDVLLVPDTEKARDAVFCWVRGGGGAWVPLSELPDEVVSALKARLARDRCAVGQQARRGTCVKRPEGRGGARCLFRQENDGNLQHQLANGFVFPRPNLPRGSPAQGEDLLSHYFLRPGGVYNIALSMPASGASSLAIDVAKAGDEFFLHDGEHGRAQAPYFYAGTGTCADGKLEWVYGAPESTKHPGEPDWERAGWVPKGVLHCQ